MRRQKFSPEEQNKYRQQIAQKRKLDEANHRLLNQKFKKSFFFISSLTVRLLYVSLFFIVLLFHEKSKSFDSEVVINKDVENYTSVGKYGRTHKTKDLYLETDKDEYTINVSGQILPAFEINDTLLIERNIFGKPIYFTKAEWGLKYGIPLHYLYYCVILIFTLFSLFLNDGPSKFINGILTLAMTLNLIGILGYFLS